MEQSAVRTVDSNHLWTLSDGHAGNTDDAVVVGSEDLLDVAHRDGGADGGPAVPRHDHTPVESGGHDGGAVHDVGTGLRQNLWRVLGHEVGEGGCG